MTSLSSPQEVHDTVLDPAPIFAGGVLAGVRLGLNSLDIVIVEAVLKQS